jgi:hypothetical protein
MHFAAFPSVTDVVVQILLNEVCRDEVVGICSDRA